ncbi:MAG TPA: type VI secretion system amidase effector protein Tae4 [Fimbriiglobus sp.]|jgi:hypothetical protein
MKPKWVDFWAEYPDYTTDPNSATVKSNIGGSVDESWIVNTCAIRMSRGLNYSGVTVPGSFPWLLTVKGADGRRYGLRVAEMRKWLPHPLGTPDVDITKKAGDAFDKSTIASRKGIIAFDIHFSDATGHLDAWNGSTFSHEYAAGEYWEKATRITIWALS